MVIGSRQAGQGLTIPPPPQKLPKGRRKTGISFTEIFSKKHEICKPIVVKINRNHKKGIYISNLQQESVMVLV